MSLPKTDGVFSVVLIQNKGNLTPNFWGEISHIEQRRCPDDGKVKRWDVRANPLPEGS